MLHGQEGCAVVSLNKYKSSTCATYKAVRRHPAIRVQEGSIKLYMSRDNYKRSRTVLQPALIKGNEHDHQGHMTMKCTKHAYLQ